MRSRSSWQVGRIHNLIVCAIVHCYSTRDAPDHYINLVIRLHKDVKVKVKIGDIDYTVDSSIGVRQGSCEGPVLFLFIMQAAMETLVWPEGVEKPQFRTRQDGMTMGEKWIGSEERLHSNSGLLSLLTTARLYSTAEKNWY